MAAFTRRTMLTATSVPLAALATRSLAAVEPARRQGPGAYRMRLGAYQLTALYDGWWRVPIDDHFVRNATRAEVNEALATGFLAPDILPVSFTALLVNTGKKLILIDTGTAGQIADSAGSLIDNLAAAGVAPTAIDTVLISHFHPDHIDGLRGKDGERTFPNADILVPEAEWEFWMDDANLHGASGTLKRYFLNVRRIFADIAKDVARFTPGKEVAPGIVAEAAQGHTPGHVAFTIASGPDTLLVLSDSARNPWLFVRHPDWQPSFDMDGPLAAATRRRLLDRAAADRIPVHGYHFPFPALGHIARNGRDFDLVPALWQPL